MRGCDRARWLARISNLGVVGVVTWAWTAPPPVAVDVTPASAVHPNVSSQSKPESAGPEATGVERACEAGNPCNGNRGNDKPQGNTGGSQGADGGSGEKKPGECAGGNPCEGNPGNGGLPGNAGTTPPGLADPSPAAEHARSGPVSEPSGTPAPAPSEGGTDLAPAADPDTPTVIVTDAGAMRPAQPVPRPLPAGVAAILGDPVAAVRSEAAVAGLLAAAVIVLGGLGARPAARARRWERNLESRSGSHR